MTKYLYYFQKKTLSKCAIFFLIFGTSFFYSSTANAIDTGPVTITCANASGVEETTNTGWNNSNQFFAGKGDIARLFCEGGFNGDYKTFISTSLMDLSLRYYQGVVPQDTQTSTGDSQTAGMPQDSSTSTVPPQPVTSDTPTAQVDTSTSTVPQTDSHTAVTPSPTSTPSSDTHPTMNGTESTTADTSESQTSTSESSTQTIPQETSTTVVETPSQPSSPSEPAPSIPDVPPAVVPQPVPAPEPPVEPAPSPQPEPEPEPELAPVEPEPAPEPEPPAEEPPVPVEEPPVPVDEPPAPVEEPPAEEEEPPAEEVPAPEVPEPAPEPPSEPPLVEPEPPVVATEDSTPEEKEAVAEALIESAQGEPVTAQDIQDAGLTYADLPPDTPVEVRQDEDGNEVVITAEVAAALVILENPAELLNAIFTDPSQALLAIASIGADMSDEERAESEKIIVASVIAGQAAVTAAGAVGAAAYRRKP